MLHTSTVAAATAVSTVPIETNITSTTDSDSLVDNEQTRNYAEASNSINTNNLNNPYHYIVTMQATIVSELQKTRDVLQALKIEAREREATQTHHANAMEHRLLHDLHAIQTTVSLKVDTLAATIAPRYQQELTRKKQQVKKKAALKYYAALKKKAKEALVKRKLYFSNRFAVAFKPKEEIKNNMVTVITELDPKAIFNAIENNTTTSLNIAPAEHDLDCRQVCGKLPVTEKVRQAFTTGHGICLITTLLNYYYGINKEKFHTGRKVSSHLSPDLIGGIHEHGLVPLQSIDKKSERENVWMGDLHAVPWMAGHVIKNQAEELEQSDNQLVCIVILPGDPRLDLFRQFGVKSRYTDYVNPVTSPSIVKVFGEDTVLFPANAIPRFIAIAPEHPSVVRLRTEEEKQNRKLAYNRSYYREHIEERRLYDQSYYREHREWKRLYNRSYNQSKKNRNV